MDMLVNLLSLPDDSSNLERLKREGFNIRRIRTYELSILRRFIIEHFSERWADEASASINQIPATCFIATKDGCIKGFAAFECTAKDYFGPTGVAESARGKGLGTSLLLACLHAMREMGYAYAVIGGAGPKEFYSKICGAMPIAGSEPGIYTDWLKED